MVNNIKIEDSMSFFMNTKLIEIDIDRQYSQVVELKNPPSASTLIQFDNYQQNTTFTSMMSSYFIDVLKRVYLAIQKHHQIEIEVCFDGT
jgi:hypothetical protein